MAAVKGDTGNILGQAGGANDTAACISRKLFGQSGDDGDCQGQATPAASQRSRDISPSQLQSPQELQDLIPDETPPPSSDPGLPDPVPAPVPEQGQPLPLPEQLPETPRPLGDIIDRLLPGQDQVRPGGQPPGDLLERLLPGLGLR